MKKKLLPILALSLGTVALLHACGKKNERTEVTTGQVTTDEDNLEVPDESGQNLRMIRKASWQTNQIRRRNGLAPLQFDPNLARAARMHAREMSQYNYLEHQDRNGRSPRDRMRMFNLNPLATGENLALDNGSVQNVFDGWMSSEGHRRNLLNPTFRRHGIGHANGYWVQVFSN